MKFYIFILIFIFIFIFMASCKEIQNPEAHKFVIDLILNPNNVRSLKQNSKIKYIDSIISNDLNDSIYKETLIDEIIIIFERNLKNTNYIGYSDSVFTSESSDYLKQLFSKQNNPKYFLNNFDGFYELYYFKRDSGVSFFFLLQDSSLYLFHIEVSGNNLSDMW